ncbi:MAG TPA: twin-arginine translocase TatA/TatE family subunit [Anaeromyxobacter sp.]
MGFLELLLILVIVVFLFGARKLPALGEGLGKAIRGFKDGMRGEPPAPAAKKELPPGDDGGS